MSETQRLYRLFVRRCIKFLDLIISSREVRTKFIKIRVTPKGGTQALLLRSSCSIRRGRDGLVRLIINTLLGRSEILKNLDEFTLICLGIKGSAFSKALTYTLLISMASGLIAALLEDVLHLGSGLGTALGIGVGVAALVQGLITLLESRVRDKEFTKVLKTHNLLLNTNGTYRELFNIVSNVVGKLVSSEGIHRVEDVIDSKTIDRYLSIRALLKTTTKARAG